MIFQQIFYFLSFCYLFSFCICQDKDENGKISLSVPQLSEEETESNHMPQHLKCDACLAITVQIGQAFTKALSRKKTLKEYDVLEILENTCNNGFSEYGVKQMNGINRLSGPGLEAEHFMGMTQMGGRWSYRIQEMCHYYIGEIGELEIYEAFSESRDSLVELLCYGSGISGYCKHLKNLKKTEL